MPCGYIFITCFYILQHYSSLIVQFQGLTYGYLNTNGSAVLESCLAYAMDRHSNFLPGEAGFLLKILREVDDYLTEKGSYFEQEIAADIIAQILDVILRNEHSVNNQEVIFSLAKVV